MVRFRLSNLLKPINLLRVPLKLSLVQTDIRNLIHLVILINLIYMHKYISVPFSFRRYKPLLDEQNYYTLCKTFREYKNEKIYLQKLKNGEHS